jgi:hypothetical protein
MRSASAWRCLEWRRFLKEMSVRRLPVYFFATIRATDIVRDAEFLHLYRQAGILYVLMGIESTNDQVLKEIRKGSTTRDDFMACQLLKQHGIFSILGQLRRCQISLMAKVMTLSVAIESWQLLLSPYGSSLKEAISNVMELGVALPSRTWTVTAFDCHDFSGMDKTNLIVPSCNFPRCQRKTSGESDGPARTPLPKLRPSKDWNDWSRCQAPSPVVSAEPDLLTPWHRAF